MWNLPIAAQSKKCLLFSLYCQNVCWLLLTKSKDERFQRNKPVDARAKLNAHKKFNPLVLGIH